MNNVNFKEQNKSVKYWGLNMMLGIVFILASIFVFAKPETSYNSLAIILNITLFFTGTLGIISSIQNRDLLNGWGLSFTVGIIDLLVSISIIIISKPQISTEALNLITIYVFLYHTVLIIARSIELKKYEAIDLGWLFFGTILGYVLSFHIIWNNSYKLSTHLFLISFALLIIGFSEFYFSTTLSKINHKIA